MYGRRRFVSAGAAIVGLSVSVIAGVAMSNAVALADTPGIAIGGDGIVVPGAPAPATPSPTRTAAPEKPTPTPAAEPEDAGSETVAAPSPIEVTDVPEDAISGDWSQATLREWGESHGWSQGKIERWVAHVDAVRERVREAQRGSSGSGAVTFNSQDWGSSALQRDSTAAAWSLSDQSRDSPDRRD